MIVLLNYSINSLSQTINNSSTGRLDSVYISINDIKLANSKLIQLEYEQKINNSLKEIIKNDSLIIKKIRYDNDSLSNKINHVVKERNIFIGTSGLLLLLLILKLL